MAREIKYLVIHTAADSRKDGCNDTTAQEIRNWHRKQGYKDIGYHYVVRRSGEIEAGRPLSKAGAHARGVNHNSIGICLSGHGDLCPPTNEQWQALVRLTQKLASKYKIPAERIIGHREVNKLVEQGILSKQYRTTKSCPGRLVNMDKLRAEIQTP